MVRFENPQPKDIVALEFFPEQMRGNFISDEQDTLEIDSINFHFKNGEEIDMKGSLTSAENILKQIGKYYIINIHEEDGWDVFPIRAKKDQITVFYTSLSSEVDDLMEELSTTSPVLEVNDSTGNLKYYLIDPAPQEFKTLLRKNLYDEKIIFKRMN